MLSINKEVVLEKGSDYDRSDSLVIFVDRSKLKIPETDLSLKSFEKNHCPLRLFRAAQIVCEQSNKAY
jgi:hypothetical protein